MYEWSSVISTSISEGICMPTTVLNNNYSNSYIQYSFNL